MNTRGTSQLARWGRVLVALGAAALSGSACAPHDAPGLCRGQGDCDKDTACIVGRCRPRAAPVVSTSSRRVVLEPTEVALLTSKERERVDVPAVAFGRISSGDVVLLLAFDDTLGSEVEVEHAFLVLDPADDAPSPYAAVPIEVAPILETWSCDAVSWGRSPETGLPETVADASPQGHRSLRVEVTHLLEARGRHGFAVSATARDPIGAFYATGIGASAAPRLELYLKGVEAQASPSASAAPSASASAAHSASAPPASASAASEDDGPPRRRSKSAAPRPADGASPRKPSKPAPPKR